MRMVLAVLALGLALTAGTASAAPDFTLSVDPAAVAVDAGGAASVRVTVSQDVAAAPQTVSLSISGLPAGVRAVFDAQSIDGNGSTMLTFSADAAAEAAEATVTVTGTAGAITHTVSIALAVVKATADFSIAVSPSSFNLPAGSSVVTQVSTALLDGVPATVSFSVSGLTAGTTGAFSPTSALIGGTVSLTFNATSSATNGAYLVHVTATGAGISRSTSVTMFISGGETPLDLRLLIERALPAQVHAHLANAARFAFRGAFDSSCRQLGLAAGEAPSLADPIAGVENEFGC